MQIYTKFSGNVFDVNVTFATSDVVLTSYLRL